MKVYVDELPKSCIDCPCESEGFCNLIPLDYCYGTPQKDCPLQSLADHNKQVRKQVCDEIRNRSAKSYSGYAFNLGKDVYSYTVCDFVLDQIEKGE